MNIQIKEKLKNNLSIICQSINGDMAKHSCLFFTVSMILLGQKQGSETYMWGLLPLLKSLPSPPVSLCTSSRIILIILSLISIIFIPIIIRRDMLPGRLANFLRRRKWVVYLIGLLLLLFILWLIPPIPLLHSQIVSIAISIIFTIAVFCKWLANKLKDFSESSGYWLIFLTVYTAGWAGGLSNTQSIDIAYRLIFWLGLVLFCIIAFVMFKTTVGSGKHDKTT
jgi:hypothetical protein